MEMSGEDAFAAIGAYGGIGQMLFDGATWTLDGNFRSRDHDRRRRRV